MLPSYPICLEWLDYDPTESGAVNYLAIGSLNPWIEIWDLDLVDSLEPEFILGSMEKIKKKKDPTKKQKILGHRSAVLDLSWNRLNTTVLASGSADKSIILWDLKKLKKATRIKNHTGKVQSVQWHPIEAFSLLSGSADKTVALYDCRNPNTNKKTWSLEQEIEQVLWNNHDPNYFLVRHDYF
jgi:periodic tryptophan protein 1